jgi:hypothetical protein
MKNIAMSQGAEVIFGERYVYVFIICCKMRNLITYDLALLSKLINRYNIAID